MTVVAECTILAAVRTALTVRFPDSPMFVDNSPLTVSLLIVSYQSFTQILLCLLQTVTLNMYFIFLKNNYWHFFQKVGRRQIIGTFFKKLGSDSNK